MRRRRLREPPSPQHGPPQQPLGAAQRCGAETGHISPIIQIGTIQQAPLAAELADLHLQAVDPVECVDDTVLGLAAAPVDLDIGDPGREGRTEAGEAAVHVARVGEALALQLLVIPAKPGIQSFVTSNTWMDWVPAFAGTTRLLEVPYCLALATLRDVNGESGLHGN